MNNNHDSHPRAALGSASKRTSALSPEVNSGNGDDANLLNLEKQFNALAAELAELACDRQGITCSDQGPSAQETIQPSACAQSSQDRMTLRAEVILARMHPIEQAIMETPAQTIAGLGVKARHTAHVTSQYWSAPINQIDWDAQVVRLLIEAVCNVARVPLPLARAMA
jgi:hypothetical protein